MRGGLPAAGDIYLEFLRQGNAMRATAIDAATGIEASVLGPLTAPKADLEKLAVGKLMRALGRAPGTAAGEDPARETPPGTGRGIVV